MTTTIPLKYRIVTVILLLLFTVQGYGKKPSYPRTDLRAKQMESKADRSFVKGDYNRAMASYRQADTRLAEGSPKYQLKLKMARLYTLLQEPKEAIRYYDAVQCTADTMLTVNDICFFIDALRQNGEAQRAEIIARKYAFRNPFSRNQRFMNMLQSLSNNRYYYAKGGSDYAVKLFERSTELPEYWLGNWEGNSFYAASHSRMQDPLKVFYHRTQYFALNSDKALKPFKSIPRELQSGPVAFAGDKTRMVATGISYRSADRITGIGTDKGMYATQLYYSNISHRSGGWSSFEPLFDLQEGFSYAHPTFFNQDKSLVFSSDRPGGYGGMDLYISHWNEALGKWGEPINMGPLVNTEGDEIYPRIIDDGLYFSSNGQVGFGGYDIYRVSFGHNLVLPGSMFHYPYPINSANNDFGLFFDTEKGYFISDRRGASGKDDIYSFDNSITPLGSQSAIGVSDEYSAMAGNLNLITGLKSSNTQTFEKELLITPTYRVPDEGEILLSVYFDFNRYTLDYQAVERLNRLLENPAMDDIEELYVIGYADEFGSQHYNKHLSMQRAEAVASFMNAGKFTPTLVVEGRGQLSLSQEEYREAMQQAKPTFIQPFIHKEVKTFSSALSFEDRVRLNRTLRRVDVIVKKK